MTARSKLRGKKEAASSFCPFAPELFGSEG